MKEYSNNNNEALDQSQQYKECMDPDDGQEHCFEKEIHELRDSSSKVNSWKFRIKKDLFGTTKFTGTSEIYKLTVTSIFLALSVSLSLIELKGIKWPWGSDLDYRIFDSLLLFFSIRMVGLVYSILIATLMPWIHVAIDGAHSPISMVGFMVGDILCVILFWIIYYKVFRAGVQKDCFTKDIQENDSRTGIKHAHQFKNDSVIKRVIALSVISVVCAFIEALMQDAVFWIMISGLASPKVTPDGDGEMPVDTLKSFFYGIKILWVTLFLAGIYWVKYIAEVILFFITEKRMAVISDRFGIW